MVFIQKHITADKKMNTIITPKTDNAQTHKELSIRERVDQRRTEQRQTPSINITVPRLIEEVDKDALMIARLNNTNSGYERITQMINGNPISNDMITKYDNFVVKNKQYCNVSLMNLINFKGFIKDKSIALIANSSILKKNKFGAEIDSHDIVIRFNSFDILPEITGEKTTMHVSIYLQDYNLDKYVPIRVIISTRFNKWQEKLSSISPYNQGTFLAFNNYHRLIQSTLHKSAFTSGFTMLLLLKMIGGFNKVSMYGFDMYVDRENSILRVNGAESFPISNAHDYELESKILKSTADVIDKVYFNYIYYGNRSL